MFPFIEKNILICGKNRIVKRIFKKELDNSLLNWHIDKEDRYIKIINCKDWHMQFENKIPFPLIKDQIIFIKKGRWHRIINRKKGNLDLLVLKEIE